MLTFFEVWPAFHICLGQGGLFALTIIGDPQLLFRTLEEPLKSLFWCGMLRCTEKTAASGEVSLECTCVKLQSNSGLFSFEALSAHMHFQASAESCVLLQSVCANTLASSANSDFLHKANSSFSRLYTLQEPRFLKRI